MIHFFYNSLKISITLVLVMYSFLLLGCRTSPEFALQNYPGVIADDGNLLVHFNLSKDSVILNQFLSRYSTDDLSTMIERTERLSMSIDSLGSDSKFSILAEGNFPKFFTNLAIGREENWIKHKDNYVWWENKARGLYASVPIRTVALISSNNLNSRLSFIESGNRKYIPENIKAQFTHAAITLYSRFPGTSLYESFNIPAEKMSIQELSFVINKDGDKYKIFGILQFSNESDAKIFSTALKLGLLMKLRETGKLSVMKLVHDSRIEVLNSAIIMDNILFNSEEILEFITVSSQAIKEN